jgi:phosphate transport system substrate-binding protein
MVGKAKASRGDYTASEDDNVLVQGVSRDINAIGYFGYAYYAENTAKLKALAIVNPKTGKPVEPSATNVENGSYTPLSRPIFVYLKVKSMEKPEVKEFVEFYMKNAAKLTKEVKYVPLPAAGYTGNIDHMNKKKIGTVFGGKNEIGITIEELMKREAKM